MVSVSADDLEAVLNLTGTPPSETVEKIIDLAIDMLNLFGAAISNMTGDEGAKTVTLTSKEKAAVFVGARAIYYGFYKGIDNLALAGLSITESDLMGNSEVMNTIRQAAKRLEQHEGVAFMVGEATS